MNVIVVNGTQARTFDGVEPFVTGQSNFDKVEFRFDNAWDGMTKIAQFVQGSNRYNVAVENNECICPSELVKGCVFVRVRGYSATDVIATANEIQIPVEQGFEPGGVPSVPPTPDLYQKLLGTVQDQIGDLSALKTEDKSSLVAAINEVQETGGGGGTSDHSKLKNRDTADQHPMSAITGLEQALEGKQDAGSYITEEADPTVPEWAKQPQKPAYTAQEVGALPDTTRIPTALSELSEDATHRVVTDAEKAEWNAKSNFTGSYNDLTDKPTIPAPYTLPIAGPTVLGGVQPVAKTEAMTQAVGVDEAGALWTAPGGADRWELIAELAVEEEINKIVLNGFSLKKCLICAKFIGTATNTVNTNGMLEVNGESYLWANVMAQGDGITRYIVSYLEVCGEVKRHVSSKHNNNWMQVNGLDHGIVGDGSPISEISFDNISTNVFGVGTTIQIYGVRT